MSFSVEFSLLQFLSTSAMWFVPLSFLWIVTALLDRKSTILVVCRILDLADCRGLSSTALRKILCESETDKNLRNLEALILDSKGELDNPLITDICLSLPKLARLSLTLCTGISDEGVKGIAAGCGPRLTELCLDEVTKITDEALLALSESCTSLQVC